MIRNAFGVGLLVAVVCSVLSVLFVSPTHAVLEKYSWKTYNQIGGRIGEYNRLGAGEGGATPIIFKQDANDVSKFVSDKPGNSCTGKLILTVIPNDSTGIITKEGDCSFFDNLDKGPVAIGAQDVARQAVTDEADKIRKLFTDEACKGQADLQKTACEEAAKIRFAAEGTKCQIVNDYATNVVFSNNYLNCVAKSVGVDRAALHKEPETPKGPDGGTESCAIGEAVGWLMCQGIEYMAMPLDYGFSLLENFLQIEPLKAEVSPNSQSTTYSAWKSFLAIANIMIAIGFIVMIYSYLTGQGIQMYHIKKTLPRTIVAALLINLSFYICALAVDLSNITGHTMQQSLVTFTNDSVKTNTSYTKWGDIAHRVISIGATDQAFNDQNDPEAAENRKKLEEEKKKQAAEQGPSTADANAANSTDAAQIDTMATTSMIVFGVAIYGTGVLFMHLAALVPLMIMAMFSLFTVLIILLIRQAVVIMLVVIAPLAFACIVLPNTQKLFDKWKTIFVSMLVLYPAIALIFGGSYFASKIVAISAKENGQLLLSMFSLGILVIPLFITPMLMKLGGGVMNRFTGLLQRDPNKGVYGRAMKWGNEFKDGRETAANIRGANAMNPLARAWYKPRNIASARRRGKQFAKQDAENMRGLYTDSDEVADRIGEKSVVGIKGPEHKAEFKEDFDNAAIQRHRELHHKLVTADEIRIRNMHLTSNEIDAAALSGSLKGRAMNETERQAINRMATEDVTASDARLAFLDSMIERSSEMTHNQRIELVTRLRAAGVSQKNPHFSATFLQNVEDGNVNSRAQIDQAMIGAAESGKFGPLSMANASPRTLAQLATLRTRGDISTKAWDQIRIDANHVITHTDAPAAGVARTPAMNEIHTIRSTS